MPSLDRGRRRGRTTFRILVALATAGVIVGLVMLWPEDGSDSVRTGPRPPDQTTIPSPSATGGDTPTPAPDDLLDLVLWPNADGQRFTDPSDAARSCVEEFMGVPDLPLSEFRELSAGRGEIDVFARGEVSRTHEPAVSTIGLGSTEGRWVEGRLEGGHWYVEQDIPSFAALGVRFE